jgi:hypothetical protein
VHLLNNGENQGEIISHNYKSYMKKKKSLAVKHLAVMFFFINIPLMAQIECGTILDKTKILPDSILEIEKLNSLKGNQVMSITYIPIRPFLIRNGMGYIKLTVNELNQLLNDLNSEFLRINIQFYFLNNQYSYLNDSQNYVFDINNQNTFCNQYDIGNAVNLYFFGSFTNSNIKGIANFPKYIFYNSSDQTNRILMSTSGTIDSISSTLIHEFGHYFGLFHTHETINGQEYPSGSNCSYSGDLLCDTPADPFSVISDLPDPSVCVIYNRFFGYYYWGCSYYLLGYEYNPPINNYMSYYNKSRNSFTNGQLNRMTSALSYRIYSDSNSPINERYYLDGIERITVSGISSNNCFGQMITLSYKNFGVINDFGFTVQIRDINSNIISTQNNLYAQSLNIMNGYLTFNLPSVHQPGNYQFRIICNNPYKISEWTNFVRIKSKNPNLEIVDEVFSSGSRTLITASDYLIIKPNVKIESNAVFEAKIDSQCY